MSISKTMQENVCLKNRQWVTKNCKNCHKFLKTQFSIAKSILEQFLHKLRKIHGFTWKKKVQPTLNAQQLSNKLNYHCHFTGRCLVNRVVSGKAVQNSLRESTRMFFPSRRASLTSNICIRPESDWKTFGAAAWLLKSVWTCGLWAVDVKLQTFAGIDLTARFCDRSNFKFSSIFFYLKI